MAEEFEITESETRLLYQMNIPFFNQAFILFSLLLPVSRPEHQLASCLVLVYRIEDT